MVRSLLPISALLLGSAFLLFAGGINGLILPIRGGIEGFSAVSLGLLGTGWAIGYVSGCLTVPRLVARIGHIRAFGVMAAFAAISILCSLLILLPWAWIGLRALAGFCFAGAAMIVESWLSERADRTIQGRVFGVYTMVNLFASTAGQLTLILGDARGFLFFVLPAIFYCLALVPTAVSSSTTPKPLAEVRLDLRALWRNSPVAVFAVAMVGVSNAAFGTLAAVYADRIGLMLAGIALFASLPILAGAAAQIPVGLLSDRFDRRKVLLGTALVAVAADLAFLLIAPESRVPNLVLAGVFGAAVFAMYPIVVAHANDHAAPGTYIQTSSGLLLVFGLGSIVGPLVAGLGMTYLGVAGLFLTTLVAHLLMIAFILLRIARRAPVPVAEKTGFVPMPGARTATPELTAIQAEALEAAETQAEIEPPGHRSEAETAPQDAPRDG